MLAQLLGLSAAWAPATGPSAPARPRAAVRCQGGVYNPEQAGFSLEASASTRPEGSHGTGYRFMPLSAMPKAPSPVLMPIAGAYPGLTSDQLAAPFGLPQPEDGKWVYHRLLGEGLPTGFVALPGSDQLANRPNCVVVVCTSSSLGLELADGQVRPAPSELWSTAASNGVHLTTPSWPRVRRSTRFWP